MSTGSSTPAPQFLAREGVFLESWQSKSEVLLQGEAAIAEQASHFTQLTLLQG